MKVPPRENRPQLLSMQQRFRYLLMQGYVFLFVGFAGRPWWIGWLLGNMKSFV